jgi:hypothetical protein
VSAADIRASIDRKLEECASACWPRRRFPNGRAMPADRLDFLRDDHGGLARTSARPRPERKGEWHWTGRCGRAPRNCRPRATGGLAGDGRARLRQDPCRPEWVRTIAEADPEARIALVGASLHEARAVMVEGESGVWRSARRPPALRTLAAAVIWPNGAQATLYSAAEPDAARPAAQPCLVRRDRQMG